MSVADRAALVTGATVIGAAVARTFVKAGARVAIVDAEDDKIRRIVGEIAAAGGEAFGIARDVHVRGEALQTVADSVHRMGRLDILVTALDVAQDSDLLTMTLEQWTSVLSGNLTPVFLICQAAAAHMVECG